MTFYSVVTVFDCFVSKFTTYNTQVAAFETKAYFYFHVCSELFTHHRQKHTRPNPDISYQGQILVLLNKGSAFGFQDHNQSI